MIYCSSKECHQLLDSSAHFVRDRGLLTLHTIIKPPIHETKGDPAPSLYSHNLKKIHGSDSKRPAILIILQIHTGNFAQEKHAHTHRPTRSENRIQLGSRPGEPSTHTAPAPSSAGMDSGNSQTVCPPPAEYAAACCGGDSRTPGCVF